VNKTPTPAANTQSPAITKRGNRYNGNNLSEEATDKQININQNDRFCHGSPPRQCSPDCALSGPPPPVPPVVLYKYIPIIVNPSTIILTCPRTKVNLTGNVWLTNARIKRICQTGNLIFDRRIVRIILTHKPRNDNRVKINSATENGTIRKTERIGSALGG